MIKKNIKINNQNAFIPYKLIENIIKETNVEKITIEEEQSELYYETLSGLGKIFFKNNSIYEGHVKYGILDSADDQTSPNHNPNYLNTNTSNSEHEPTETKNKITFANGTTYIGDIRNNTLTGKGEYQFNTGSTYDGQVKNGLRNGFGDYKSNDGISYSGEWLNGLKHGRGKMMMKDGMIYEGSWHEGVIQGYGEMKWASGNSYKGQFKNNKINGNGYLIWYDSSEKYIGQWNDTFQNGLGIHIWYEAKGEQKYLRNRYVGEWRSGFRHGYGVFFYSNGAKYEGTWDQNYKHGFGVFTFHDGSQYIGKFHNDRMIDYNPGGVLVPGLGGVGIGKPQDTGRQTNTNNLVKGLKKNSELGGDRDRGDRQDKGEKQDTNPTNQNKQDLNTSSVTINKQKNLAGGPSGTSNVNNSNNNNKLSLIPEGNETNRLSIFNQSNQLKDASTTNNFNPVVSNKAALNKDSELNQFKTSLDIADLIEFEPDIENSLKEIENILLRLLTDMKIWYRYYTNGGTKDDALYSSANASIQVHDKTINEEKDKVRSNTNLASVNANNIDCIYNNDLGFCMELKDLWKFIRDSHILSSDFSLANFNRVFFKGPKNYIEMFMCPDDLETGSYYDYIYLMIGKAREEFFTKYKHVRKSEENDESSYSKANSRDGKDGREMLGPNSNYNSSNNNNNNNINPPINNSENPTLSNSLEINFDIHNKHQVILLRQFYEAIVRMAYLKYYHLSQPLHVKLNSLIDNHIRLNLNLKKGPSMRKSHTAITDSSLNLSVLEMKVKNIENSMDSFFSANEKKLKHLFKLLYYKSNTVIKKYDMTVTFRYFYDKIVSKSVIFKEHINDKSKFIELINIYHKDKLIITEENRKSLEVYSYMESLLDNEFIFLEFCEMTFYICKKCSGGDINHNNHNKSHFGTIRNENKSDRDKGYKTNDILLHLQDMIEANQNTVEVQQKKEYFYPRLDHHKLYERIIQLRKQKEEEDKKRKIELARVEMERKLMIIEDQNVMPEYPVEEDEGSYESDDY